MCPGKKVSTKSIQSVIYKNASRHPQAAAGGLTCASIKLLEHLDAMGYRFKMATHDQVDAAEIPPVGAWQNASGFDMLADFPSVNARVFGKTTASTPMHAAYLRDFTTFSTNLFAVRDEWSGSALPWPSLTCEK